MSRKTFGGEMTTSGVKMENIGTGNINLRGMIQLNQVEDLLSQILNKIQIQDQEIMNIKETIPQYAVADHVDQNIDDLQKAIRVLNNRLDGLREASTVRLPDRIITSSDLSLQNKIRLDNLTNQLEIYAENSLIQDQITTIIKKYDESIQSIHDNYTPYHLTQSLQRSTAEYLSILQKHEEIISTKMNRSEICHVEYLYQELTGYQETIHNLQQGYEELIKELNDFNEQTERKMKKMKDENEKINKQLEKNFINEDEKILEKLSQVREELNSFQASIPRTYTPLTDQLKNLNSFKEVKNSLMLLTKDLELHRVDLNDLQHEMKLKAYHQDVMRGYVRKEVFTEVMKSLGEEVDKKSTLVEMTRHENEIQTIYQHLTSHESQIQIAIRFVNWFTQRGEVYDYNIRVIDKHLSKLATSSITAAPQHPQQLQPSHEIDDDSNQITYLPKYVSKENHNRERR